MSKIALREYAGIGKYIEEKLKDCSSKVFIKAFVYSTISKDISNKSFYLNSIDITLAYDLIKKEKKLTRGKDIYHPM